jgi:hypothetical protein
MRSNLAPRSFAAGGFQRDQPALDGVMLAGLAFRESMLGGRTYLEAYGVDPEGDIVVLAPRRAGAGGPAERAELFSSLLARGLRAYGSILVDACGCSVLQHRIRAAWGVRAVLLDA